MAFDIQPFATFVSLMNGVVTLYKSATELLPNGPSKEKAEAKLRDAEAELQQAHLQLQKDLNYKFCHCAYPPGLMLWRKDERAFVCNKCEDRNEIGPEQDDYVRGAP